MMRWISCSKGASSFSSCELDGAAGLRVRGIVVAEIQKLEPFRASEIESLEVSSKGLRIWGSPGSVDFGTRSQGL